MQVSLRDSHSCPEAASHFTSPKMLRLLCLLAGLAVTVTGECEAPFKVVGEGCYYFSLEDDLNDSTWTEAHQYCLSLGSERDLAVMDYVCDDFRNLVDYLLVQGAFIGFRDTWIGATGGNDTWFWVDGRSLSTASLYWRHEYPSLSSGCVAVSYYTDDSHPYRMGLGDSTCTYKGPFICQDFSAALQQ